MSGIILLARHGSHAEVGRVLSGRSEIALDARGRSEAAALAAHLGTVPLASIHSSPRRRTVETAEPIARDKRLNVRISNALDEIDFGGFSGRDFTDLARDPAWHHWNVARGDARCPGGETMAEAVQRASAYLAALPPEETPALCVTHCDIIRGIVAYCLGIGLDHLFKFECQPASLTALSMERAETRLLSLNEHSWCREI